MFPPKHFNTAGPCRPDWHYMVPPIPRLPEAPGLALSGAYFVIHAPRQTGKTTLLRALAKELAAGGEVAAVYATCEAAEAAGDDTVNAQAIVVEEIVRQARSQLDPEYRPPSSAVPGGQTPLQTFLHDWCGACPRKVVLLLDEIDAVRGLSLIAVLRQLRAGYPERPDRAPWSVVLCGLRDVRDYKAASGGDPSRLGTASPFNIKLESLRIGNFDDERVRALLLQHTESTGQRFELAALERIIELSGGQPWLVNALAREVVEKLTVEGDIQPSHVEEAKERLLLARATHLNSLVSKLHEPRVQRVVAPLLAGEIPVTDPVFDDDVSYVVDLGLVTPPALCRQPDLH